MNRRYNQPWGHNNEPNRSNNQVKTCEWPWFMTTFCLHLWKLARTLTRCIMGRTSSPLPPDFAAYNKLTTWLRNIRSSLYTAKLRCFHETKQTQNEVERFLLELGRICFRIRLRQSENFSDFCKVLSQFTFRNMIVPFYTSSSARALKLPSISHTSFLT